MKNTRKVISLVLMVLMLTSILWTGAYAQESEGVNIYLVRHGKTLFNTLGYVQGYVDSPLTDAGIEGAEDTGMGLAGIKFDAAYASDRGRAVETAEIILALNGASGPLTIHELKDLREMNYGIYEGTPGEAMWAKGFEAAGAEGFQDLGTKVSLDDVINGYAAADETGECETVEESTARVMRGLTQVTGAVPSGNVLCVAHGGVISNIITSLGGVVQGEMPNSSVTVINYKDGKYTLLTTGSMAENDAGKAIRAENGGAAKYPEGKGEVADMPEPGPGKVHIYLVRHGKTLLNTAGKMQGIADAPLTDAGVQGAVDTGLGLRDIAFDAIYSSDLQRTVETIDVMLSMNEKTPLDVPRTKLKDLREYGFGIYEAQPQGVFYGVAMEKAGLSSMEEMFAKGLGMLDLYDAVAADETTLFEKAADFRTRVNRGLERVAREMSQRTGETHVMVCVHGIVMGTLLENFDVQVTGEIPNAAVVKLTYENGQFALEDKENWQDMSYNETGATMNPYRAAEEGVLAAAEKTPVTVNGTALEGLKIGDITYYPVLEAAKAAGIEASMDEAANSLVLIAHGKRVELKLNTNMYYVDTTVHFQESFTALEGDVAYAPIAFALEALDVQADIQ